MSRKIFNILLLAFLVIGILSSNNIFASKDTYNYLDNRAAAPNPPGGLQSSQVPQFVAFGFDDNGHSGLTGSGAGGGLKYITDLFRSLKNPIGKHNRKTYDGARTHFTFFVVAKYAAQKIFENPVYIKQAWHEAVVQGNEIGVHTFSHRTDVSFTVTEWDKEISDCINFLTQPFNPKESLDMPDNTRGIGIAKDRIYGFRTPFIAYNNNMLIAVKNNGFWYDCTIQEGNQVDQDGTNFLWPYTLNNGSPGDAFRTFYKQKPITEHSGLWELPCYAVMIPPDELCEQYGVIPGLRDRLKKTNSRVYKDGKIQLGLDWNMWVQFQMTKAEFLAAMKYTLDLRLNGNRCPLTFAAHSDLYSDKYEDEDQIHNATPQERREALKDFLEYALSKPAVRVTSYKELLDWLRQPKAL